MRSANQGDFAPPVSDQEMPALMGTISEILRPKQSFLQNVVAGGIQAAPYMIPIGGQALMGLDMVNEVAREPRAALDMAKGVGRSLVDVGTLLSPNPATPGRPEAWERFRERPVETAFNAALPLALVGGGMKLGKRFAGRRGLTVEDLVTDLQQTERPIGEGQPLPLAEPRPTLTIDNLMSDKPLVPFVEREPVAPPMRGPKVLPTEKIISQYGGRFIGEPERTPYGKVYQYERPDGRIIKAPLPTIEKRLRISTGDKGKYSAEKARAESQGITIEELRRRRSDREVAAMELEVKRSIETDAIADKWRESGTAYQQDRWLHDALKKSGLEFTRKGWGTDRTMKNGSIYYDINIGDDILTVRVSNHEQPSGGGFSIEKGERYGDANISVDPGTGITWRTAIEKIEATRSPKSVPSDLPWQGAEAKTYSRTGRETQSTGGQLQDIGKAPESQAENIAKTKNAPPAPPPVVEKAAAPEAGAKQPWEMTTEALELSVDKFAVEEGNIEKSILGDKWNEWNKAQREFNSRNDKISGPAGKRIKEIEVNLNTADRNRLYGVGEKGRSLDELKGFVEGVRQLDWGSPEGLGTSIGKAITDVGTKTDPTTMTIPEQIAYTKIRQAVRFAEEKGWPIENLFKSAMETAAMRFGSADKAKFMLDRWLKEVNKKPAEPSLKRLPAPPVEPGKGPIKTEMTSAGEQVTFAGGKFSPPVVETPSYRSTAADPFRAGEKLGLDLPVEGRAGKPIGLDDVVKHFSDGLKLPFRTGRIGGKGVPRQATGVYKTHPEVARTKAWGQIPEMMHEAAHHIEKKYGLDELIKDSPELKALDYDPKKQRASEGFAEFIRHWTTRSADVKTLAPEFTTKWEGFLKQHPELDKTLRSGTGLIDQYREQGALGRIKGQVQLKPKPLQNIGQKIGYGWDRMRTLFENDWHPVEQMERKAYGVTEILRAAKEGKIRPTQSPTMMYQSLKWTQDRVAKSWVFDGVRSFATGEVTHPGLKEVFQPIAKNFEDFAYYAVCRRSIERHGRGKFPGIELADAEFGMKKLETPEFKKAFEEYQSFMDAVWDYVKEAGAISDETLAAMRAGSDDYFPLLRVIEKMRAGRGGGRGYGNLGSPIKAMKGGRQPIDNPYHAIFKNISDLIGIADKARVGQAIGKMYDAAPGMGKWIEEVPIPKEGTKVYLEHLRNALENAGADLTNANLNQVGTIWRNAATRYLGKDNVLMFNTPAGEMRAFQMHPDIYRAIMQMDRVTQPFAVKYFFGPISRGIRLGATGLKAGFSLITNPIRDAQGLALQSEFLKPHERLGYGFAKGIGRTILPGDKYSAMYRDWGSDMSHFIGMDRRGLDRAISQVMADTNWKRTKNVVSHPIEIAKEILSFTEKAPRLAEYEAAHKKGMANWNDPAEARVLAQSAAADVTVNFKRMGIYGSLINSMFPFWNAQVQGLSKFMRFTHAHPLRATVRGVTGLTVPTMALYMMHKDEQWYKELPAWEKYGFFHFAMGKNSDGSDRILRLPKPFEWNAPYSGMPELALNYMQDKDPKALSDGLQALTDQIAPGGALDVGNGVILPMPIDIAPSGIKQTVEMMANYDMFRDAPIDPYWEAKTRDPEDRFSEYTTETAKFIGKHLGVSPRKLDFLMSGTTGGMATDLIKAGEGAYKPSRITKPSQYPVVSRLFVRTDTPQRKRQKMEFEHDELTQKVKTKIRFGKTDEAKSLVRRWNLKAKGENKINYEVLRIETMEADAKKKMKDAEKKALGNRP
jgi:hypothetical protein